MSIQLVQYVVCKSIEEPSQIHLVFLCTSDNLEQVEMVVRSFVSQIRIVTL